MSMFLNRLASFLETLAKKRTPEQEKQDRELLHRLMKEDEERKAQKRAEKGQKSQTYRNKGGKTAKEKMGTKLERVKGIGKPLCVFIMNTKESKTEDGYQKFVNAEKQDVAQSLKNSISFVAADGTYGWICSKADADMLVNEADFLGIPQQVIELQPEALVSKEPFKGIKIKLEGVEDVGKLKLDLNTAWRPFSELFVEDKQDKPKTEFKEAEPDVAPEPEVTPEKTEKTEEPEIMDEEEVEDESVDIEDVKKIKVGKFRSLKNPYIFILDPRKRYAEYQNFVSEDKEDKKASQVLPKALKFLVSKTLKSQEGAPVIVYFLDGKQAQDLKAELKRESRPHFMLSEFDKALFDTDEPFSDLKLGEVVVDKLLADEMNKVWMDAASQSSGNPVPVVQANTLVPLDFFRLMDKQQRNIQMYIGNQPEGAGSEDTIYILASEAEAEAFVKLVRSFKMPSNFYERMSANSDIDADFKDIDPEEFEPANVLILKAADHFNPKQIVEPTEDNRELFDAIKAESKEVLDKIERLTKEKEKIKAEPDKVKKIEEEISTLQKEMKVDQISLLHAFARVKLGNNTKKTGAFVKSKVVIGTHIANFNADMSICFLWGSITKHVTVDPKEVMKQLPFVKTVVTSYL